MKILILGAGAVGLPLAAKLSRVAEVVAVTRERYATAISAQGQAFGSIDLFRNDLFWAKT